MFRTASKLVGGSLSIALAASLTACSTDNLLALNGMLTQGTGTTSTTQGGLSVSIQTGTAGDRSAQAVVSDIDRLTFSVTETSVASQSETLDRAQLSAGKAAAMFPALLPGTASVLVQAFGADGANLGQVEATASIAAGRVTPLDLTLRLVPTVVDAGGLAAHVAIENGPVIIRPLLPKPEVRVVATGFASPEGIAFDHHHHLFVANLNGTGLSKVTLDADGPGKVEQFGPYQVTWLDGVACDADDAVYACRRISGKTPQGDLPGWSVMRVFADGRDGGQIFVHLKGTNSNYGLNAPTGIVIDRDGNAIVSNSKDWKGYLVKFDPHQLTFQEHYGWVAEGEYLVAPDQVAKDTGTGLCLPNKMAFDPAGNLIVADQGGPARRIAPDGTMTTLTDTRAEGIAIGRGGMVFLSNNWGNDQHQSLFGYLPDGHALFAMGLHFGTGETIQPTGLALDDGKLYAADYSGGAVVEIGGDR